MVLLAFAYVLIVKNAAEKNPLNPDSAVIGQASPKPRTGTIAPFVARVPCCFHVWRDRSDVSSLSGEKRSGIPALRFFRD